MGSFTIESNDQPGDYLTVSDEQPDKPKETWAAFVMFEDKDGDKLYVLDNMQPFEPTSELTEALEAHGYNQPGKSYYLSLPDE